MGKLFGFDSPIMNFLSLVVDLMILNLVTMALCLPVFTAGAALTSLYYVTGRAVRGDGYRVFHTYFSAFKSNFKQATCEWLIVLGVAAVLGADIYVMINHDTVFPRALLYFVIAIALILYVLLQFLFPLQGRFANPVKKTMKNSLMLGVSKLPSAILMALCDALPVAILMMFESATLVLFLFGLSVPAYFKAQIFVPIFKPFEEGSEGSEAPMQESQDD